MRKMRGIPAFHDSMIPPSILLGEWCCETKDSLVVVC